MTGGLPRTLDEAVQWVIDMTSEIDKESIRERLAAGEKAGDVAGLVHHGFGTFVRNQLELWDPSSAGLRQSVWDSLPPERQAFYEEWWRGKGDHKGETMHADDASQVILEEAVRKIGAE